MALIDKASLLMVPSTYEAGKLYNVLPSGNRAPDSTNQNSGYDQTRADFDFDRGSNAAATRVNASGLIEKYRENVLTYSNDFSNAAWTKTRASFIGGQAGYDGSSNAWAFVDNTNNSTHLLYQTSLSLGADVSTMSVYAKAGAVNFMAFRFEGSAVDYAYFDLANGTLGTIDSDYIEARITSVGNGWYRCEATRVLAASGNQAIILPAQTNNDPTYAGAGTTAIYIQNAQVEQGLVASSYLDSTSVTGKAGVLVDLPRINYDANGENGALLLEPSRQQLIQYSEYFGAWNAFNSTITNNDTTSPEGLANAAKLAEDSSLAFHDADFSFTFSAVSNVFSVFAKANGRDKIFLQQFDGGTFHSSDVFDLTNGTYAGGNEGSIEDFGNGWFRCSYVKTTAAGSGKLYINLHNGTSGNYQGDGSSGVHIFGAQLEAGSYATSYIPNHGESGGVTRAADSCNGGGNAESINSTEGVLFVETKGENDNTFNYISLNDGGTANYAGILYTDVDNEIAYRYYVGGSGVQIIVSNVAVTNYNKIAVKWKANDFAIWVNGIEVGTASSGSLNPSGTFNELAFARGGSNNTPFYGNVKQVAVFNEALSDSELATLTTL